jgi:hypothetical protein
LGVTLELRTEPLDFPLRVNERRSRAREFTALEERAEPANLCVDVVVASLMSGSHGRHLFPNWEAGPARVGMTQSVEKARPLTAVNSIHAMSHPPLGVVNGRELLAIIRQALAETGVKQDAAAAAARVKESQFSSALNGRGNFGVTWLWAQPDAFLLRFVELLIAARQLTPSASRARRAARVGELVRLLIEEQDGLQVPRAQEGSR